MSVALVDRGHADVTVLDISADALDEARGGLRHPGAVHWIVADLLSWVPQRRWGVWHDRAVFHFSVDPADRATQRAFLHQAVEPGGAVIVATFAEDGPTMCSGLLVQRYPADTLVEELGPGFAPVAQGRHGHPAPGGTMHHFTWVVLRADPG